MKRKGFADFWLRIVKVTIPLMIVMQMSGGVHAHVLYRDLLKKQISVSFTETELPRVIDHISWVAGIDITYNSAVLPKDKKITGHFQNRSVEEVLNGVLKPLGIHFVIVENQVVLRKDHIPEIKRTMSAPETEEMIDRRISGKVTDDNGQAMPGVSILLKGTSEGTISDAEGNFTMNVPDGPALLVFSFVGYTTEEINAAGNQSQVAVTLNVDEKALEEVVVVGYGTQKKVNLTGSVSTVAIDDMKNRQVANSMSALQGKVAGLRIVQGTGMPGRESVSVQLRGASSWGTNTTPLVLVDGVVGSLDGLPMTDIESISVLKDAASASIYGARAANGVILVTTKQGKSGKPVLSYSTSIRSQSPTGKPNQIWNSKQYMELFNKAVERNAVSASAFPQAIIDKYSSPSRNMDLYPDFDWSEAVWKKALMQEHNVGISGGSENVRYNISAGILDQEGVLIGHNYKRINGLANISSTINKFVTVGTNISYLKGKSVSPYYENQNFVLMTMTQSPLVKPYLPDGSGRYTDKALPTGIGGTQNNRNPFWIANETYRNYEDWQANIQGWADVNFLHGKDMRLKWSTKYATRFADQFRNIYHYGADAFYYLAENEYNPTGSAAHQQGTPFGPEALGVFNHNYRTILNTFFSALTWEVSKGNHDITLMGGYSQESQNYRWLSGTRNVFPVKNMYELDGMGALNQTTSGGLTEWAFRSFFGRATYAFKSKYLFEANFRYDGTSRIHEDSRWGFFPSGSGAWRISEESFIKEGAPWIDNLKVRGSFGLLGNANIGDYPYQDTYVTTSYGFNETLQQGVLQTSFRNKALQWEKTAITDIGLDFNLRNDIFYGTVDWYNKYTTGILAAAVIPASAGMSAPTINYGEFRNYGIEFDFGHKNQIGSVDYGLTAQASINRNKVMKFPTPVYGERIIEEGHPYNDYFLYEHIGLFKSQEELDAVVTPGNPQIGDIKFKDQNNDGKIDGNDRIRVNGAYPDLIYSFGANIGWKNFNLSAFFQGVKGQKVRTFFFGEDPFSQGSSPHPKFLDAYDPITNPDSDIPAIYGWGYAPMTGSTAQGSTYFLKDASYLRLKNIQLGYTIPSHILQKAMIRDLKIFIAGDNILTFTKYPDLDPERAGDGWHAQYPQLKVYAVGLSMRF